MKIEYIWQHYLMNSLWPNNVIWWHRSGSTLAQVMVCWLTAPSHYLNQCWYLISEVKRYWPESNFTVSVQPTMLCNKFENCTFEITAMSSMGQWVNNGWKNLSKSCSTSRDNKLEVLLWFLGFYHFSIKGGEGTPYRVWTKYNIRCHGVRQTVQFWC